MEYKERTYRDSFCSGNRRSFSVKFKETDLWIGVDKDSYSPFMQDEALSIIVKLRNLIENPEFVNPYFNFFTVILYQKMSLSHQSFTTARNGSKNETKSP